MPLLVRSLFLLLNIIATAENNNSSHALGLHKHYTVGFHLLMSFFDNLPNIKCIKCYA